MSHYLVPALLTSPKLIEDVLAERAAVSVHRSAFVFDVMPLISERLLLAL